MKCLAVVLLSAACASNSGSEFPIEPQTSGTGASSGGLLPDAAVGDGGILGDGVIIGRVCVRGSLFTDACATAGAGGLVVRLGDQSAVTTSNGTFAITPTSTAEAAFVVSGPDVVTTSQALNARAQINVLRQQAFDDMVVSNNVFLPTNSGSIVATVFREGVPVSGVTAASTPSPAFGPFFDGPVPEPWVTNATGVRGIVWFPGVIAGPAEVSFNTLTGGSAIVGGIQVINGGITMIETPLP
jgi:hypothetical protein